MSLKNKINSLLGVEMVTNNPGVLIPESGIDTSRFNLISEIVSSGSMEQVTFVETPKDKVPTYPVQNQGYKSDCVAETRRKLLRIIMKKKYGEDLDFSAVDFYRRRANYPNEGMHAEDALYLAANVGMTLNALEPSDKLTTEAEANALKIRSLNTDIAKNFTVWRDIVHPAKDLYSVCSSMQKTGKGAMTWFYFTQSEWSKEVPTIITEDLNPNASTTIRHSVTAIYPAKYNGVNGVWIEDSAHFGGINRRFITEDFYTKRNLFASHPMKFKFDTDSDKPKYDGTTKSLQDCLKYEQLFPSNVESTGYYGEITRKAVIDFQTKYSITPTGTVGPKTTAKLKELYP